MIAANFGQIIHQINSHWLSCIGQNIISLLGCKELVRKIIDKLRRLISNIWIIFNFSKILILIHIFRWGLRSTRISKRTNRAYLWLLLMETNRLAVQSVVRYVREMRFRISSCFVTCAVSSRMYFVWIGHLLFFCERCKNMLHSFQKCSLIRKVLFIRCIFRAYLRDHNSGVCFS